MYKVLSAGKSSLAAGIRGFCFYLWTLTLSLPLFVTMLVMAPFVMLFDKVRQAPSCLYLCFILVPMADSTSTHP